MPTSATTSWTENLRCSRCGKTGQAALSEITPFNNGLDLVPAGFKVEAGPHGSDFYCETCDIPVAR